MIETTTPQKAFRPLDVFVVLILLVCGAWATTNLKGESGRQAEVRRDSKKVAWYPLNIALDTVSIQGDLGPLLLEIGQGGARMLAAPCAHQVCVRQGRKKMGGERIVCLPSRVVVSIQGGPDEGLDAVVE